MSKSNGKISRKYARALLTATNPNDLDATRDALSEFSSLWHTNTDLRDTLQNPARPLPQRMELLREVSGMLRSDKTFSNFLATLLENKRLGSVGDIGNIFSDLLNELKKQLALQITSAFPVPPTEQEEIRSKITKDFGTLASVTWTTDPSLLGGLRVKAGDRLLDGSVQSALENLRVSLMN